MPPDRRPPEPADSSKGEAHRHFILRSAGGGEQLCGGTAPWSLHDVLQKSTTVSAEIYLPVVDHARSVVTHAGGARGLCPMDYAHSRSVILSGGLGVYQHEKGFFEDGAGRCQDGSVHMPDPALRCHCCIREQLLLEDGVDAYGQPAYCIWYFELSHHRTAVRVYLDDDRDQFLFDTRWMAFQGEFAPVPLLQVRKGSHR
ncbi:MAG: hypothetical protein FRX49_06879 [Trebouxia sp. A1-2]|nr:MAG: hypothetical protein FRX49_06879 [Trebouxia sp. A1-2]